MSSLVYRVASSSSWTELRSSGCCTAGSGGGRAEDPAEKCLKIVVWSDVRCAIGRNGAIFFARETSMASGGIPVVELRPWG